MLSGFSYGKIKAYFISRGYRQGVEVHQVNPAFSSVIGRVKFMERYGLSVHQAAAWCWPDVYSAVPSASRAGGSAPVGNGVQCRLHRTCKEASEARVDVLGCDLGPVETGACSATTAGPAATPDQSGIGCYGGSGSCYGRYGDQFVVPG